jgi:hypothetical protein
MTAGPTEPDLQAMKELAQKIVQLCTRNGVHPAVAAAALVEVLSSILITMTKDQVAAKDGANIMHSRVVAAIERHARRGLNG